ncbi:hypothetical protein BCON_0094g00030 [Botryotinia convoluta]|uniref:Uncharacterized protein n=1 Tax=Botryotinia convoluta TaxID=54673 RepID=A0A4Z1I3F5_9HELO|nr:hypothetical protein BCON_0094g00030 [Botryotinia convoluta]
MVDIISTPLGLGALYFMVSRPGRAKRFVGDAPSGYVPLGYERVRVCSNLTVGPKLLMVAYLAAKFAHAGMSLAFN